MIPRSCLASPLQACLVSYLHICEVCIQSLFRLFSRVYPTNMKRQLPGEHTGVQAPHLAQYLESCTFTAIHYSHPTSQADRSMVVGNVLMVHTCSFLCPCYIGMTVHNTIFYQLGTTLGTSYMLISLDLSTSSSRTQQDMAWSGVTLTQQQHQTGWLPIQALTRHMFV